ncbi:hypothetical protein [Nonomuraea africana]|uniref:GerMN domain-containing protein n=1 Tax=Nonomuraea africana TaxID=46171 RepID=A0ABR9KN17_9ACTN|nr:hypothetical protein [Nonomuraea africana]MBE1563416.1 hypothetical protein [Nonomuraea africana]
MRRAPLLLACLALLAGCGISPTAVTSLGSPPVISTKPIFSQVFLIKKGRLELQRVRVGGRTSEDLMRTLMDLANHPTESGQDSDLYGMRYQDAEAEPVGSQERRLDPAENRSLVLYVTLQGERELSRVALAQIVCTARLRPDISKVQVNVIRTVAPSTTSGRRTCREFHDLAPPGAPS